ncbi:unnamed protein product [Cuscuta europaea]|uniref:Retrotransposon Copia-like N-terminal domain-containing protein n=1 Tax=Cuscuta europaea TaxID=41803 RepID=A0A9P0YVP0_CUSEU|nr:unnamed protein product [Cuscuta europaea]
MPAISPFASPSRTAVPPSLFLTMPPAFPWPAPTPVQRMSLDPPPLSAGPFSGPTFVGSPGVSSTLSPPRTTVGSTAGPPLADLVYNISHVATNVTNIVTTKFLAVEDYTTWCTQLQSFLVSQGLLGMVDGSIQEIKILVDNLATINCSVPPREVLKTTIMGLGPEYESLFTTLSLFPQNFPFETLRNHLLELE